MIVNLHWGTEYRHAPDAFQLALARRLARSRAITAVVGQHAHVVQPIRRIGRLWVVFGAGNLLSNQTAACCTAASQDGMLVRLHLRVGPRRAHVERITYTPIWVRHPDYVVVHAALALTGLDDVRARRDHVAPLSLCAGEAEAGKSPPAVLGRRPERA